MSSNRPLTTVNPVKCHVLKGVQTLDEGVTSINLLSSDISLFTPQELDSMDFSNIMDGQESETKSSRGIQAEDLSSLLEQFEATSSCDSSQFEFNTHSTAQNVLKDNIVTISEAATAKPCQSDAVVPTVPSKVLGKIRAGQAKKRKSAIMLPIGTPTKKVKGSKSDSQTSSGSTTLKRTIQRTDASSSSVRSDVNIEDVITDHDYCSSVTNKSLTKCDTLNMNKSVSVDKLLDIDMESDLGVSENSVSMNDSIYNMTISQESKDSGVEEGEIQENEPETDKDIVEYPVKQSMFFPCPRNLKSKRNYRKHEEPMVPDSSKYYDKIPAYFTTLSLPQKPPKKDHVSGASGINIQDYIPRDRSPTRESDSMYSKLPDYYSCFTNSTKYDQEEVEIKLEPTDQFDHEGSRDGRSCSRSSRSSSCSSSRSPSSKRGRSYDLYRRSERQKRRKHSCSTSSQSSSRSRSSSYSSSSSYSHNRQRSCSSSRSRERPLFKKNRTRPKSYRSRHRSRSRSKSRSQAYRSRSRPRSRRRSYSRSSSRSVERRRLQKKKWREEEKKQQIAERRIVYVGRIPDDFTKKDLHRRFDRFGEIISVSTHFRESGDNYGFVTFAYTCDAYAAIEKGNAVPGEMKFELCFGGRRQFCDTEYADLDGNAEEQEDFETCPPKASGSTDFDELLRQARQKIKK